MQLFFPRARTRFIRYDGVDERVGTEMNVIKDVIIEGTILNQVEKTVEYLETQVREHTFLGQHGQFVTLRDYPEFVIQEMVVNAYCHRAYNIKGTDFQIKMFDDRIVFESPGKLPGMVKPTNIRHTHFSRNPRIAAFLKASTSRNMVRALTASVVNLRPMAQPRHRSAPMISFYGRENQTSHLNKEERMN